MQQLAAQRSKIQLASSAGFVISSCRFDERDRIAPKSRAMPSCRACCSVAHTSCQPLRAHVAHAQAPCVQEFEAAQVRIIRNINHGGSVTRVYASPGAVRIGRNMVLDIGHRLPCQFYSFDMMALCKMFGYPSCRQLALVICSALFSNGSVENAITGGWSLGGSHFAMPSACELEACSGGQRAVFCFDVRSLFLVPRQLREQKNSSPAWMSREFRLRVQSRAATVSNFAGAPKWRFDVRSLHFNCFFEVAFSMNDSAIIQRVALNTGAGEMHHFPDTTHVTIGTDHMWDIARRLRQIIASKVQ